VFPLVLDSKSTSDQLDMYAGYLQDDPDRSTWYVACTRPRTETCSVYGLPKSTDGSAADSATATGGASGASNAPQAKTTKSRNAAKFFSLLGAAPAGSSSAAPKARGSSRMSWLAHLRGASEHHDEFTAVDHCHASDPCMQWAEQPDACRSDPAAVQLGCTPRRDLCLSPCERLGASHLLDCSCRDDCSWQLTGSVPDATPSSSSSAKAAVGLSLAPASGRCVLNQCREAYQATGCTRVGVGRWACDCAKLQPDEAHCAVNCRVHESPDTGAHSVVPMWRSHAELIMGSRPERMHMQAWLGEDKHAHFGAMYTKMTTVTLRTAAKAATAALEGAAAPAALPAPAQTMAHASPHSTHAFTTLATHTVAAPPAHVPAAATPLSALAEPAGAVGLSTATSRSGAESSRREMQLEGYGVMFNSVEEALAYCASLHSQTDCLTLNPKACAWDGAAGVCRVNPVSFCRHYRYDEVGCNNSTIDSRIHDTMCVAMQYGPHDLLVPCEWRCEALHDKEYCDDASATRCSWDASTSTCREKVFTDHCRMIKPSSAVRGTCAWDLWVGAPGCVFNCPGGQEPRIPGPVKCLADPNGGPAKVSKKWECVPDSCNFTPRPGPYTTCGTNLKNGEVCYQDCGAAFTGLTHPTKGNPPKLARTTCTAGVLSVESCETACWFDTPAWSDRNGCPDPLPYHQSCSVKCDDGAAPSRPDSFCQDTFDSALTTSPGGIAAQTCRSRCDLASVAAPENGQKGTCTGILNQGDSCKFSCNTGYHRLGDDMTCNDHGVFTPAANRQTCVLDASTYYTGYCDTLRPETPECPWDTSAAGFCRTSSFWKPNSIGGMDYTNECIPNTLRVCATFKSGLFDVDMCPTSDGTCRRNLNKYTGIPEACAGSCEDYSDGEDQCTGIGGCYWHDTYCSSDPPVQEPEEVDDCYPLTAAVRRMTPGPVALVETVTLADLVAGDLVESVTITGARVWEPVLAMNHPPWQAAAATGPMLDVLYEGAAGDMGVYTLTPNHAVSIQEAPGAEPNFELSSLRAASALRVGDRIWLLSAGESSPRAVRVRAIHPRTVAGMQTLLTNSMRFVVDGVVSSGWPADYLRAARGIHTIGRTLGLMGTEEGPALETIVHFYAFIFNSAVYQWQPDAFAAVARFLINFHAAFTPVYLAIVQMRVTIVQMLAPLVIAALMLYRRQAALKLTGTSAVSKVAA